MRPSDYPTHPYTHNMNRRTFLQTTTGIAAASTLGIAGCVGTASATGTLATRVSDRPGDIDDFQRCAVTVREIRVKPVDGDLETHGVEETTLDLVDLQGDRSALVDEVELDASEYEYLQLPVTDTEATLADGSNATVEVPGEAPLKFEATFEVREDERTTFTADFTPVKAGQSGKYVLQPVAEEVTVRYADETTAETAGEPTGTADGTTTQSETTATETTATEG